MLQYKMYLSIIVILFFGISFLSAQDDPPAQRFGQVEGRITDRSTGENLVGANVMIEGTNLGAATDMQGRYRIPRVPAGTHTLVISYLGYQQEREEIEVIGGEVTQVNTSLAFHFVEGEMVTITGQVEGQMRAINEQLRSRRMVNVVDSERIRELPDESAATALSRLPGISLMEGDKIVIRGMQARMNQVMVNGVQLPSTDFDDRSTNLGFISSNMLDGIEVTKSLTPDMDASAVGGTVNLRLRQAPSGFNFDMMTQGMYNTQDRTLPGENYQLWGSVSNRYFDDKLGVFVQGNTRRFDGGNDIVGASFSRMGPGADLGYGNATYGMNEFRFEDEVNINTEYGGSILLDYDLPNGKLILQNTIAFIDVDYSRHQDILDLNNTSRLFRLTRDAHNVELLINALQGEHRIGSTTLDYGFSHSRSRQDTDIMYGQPGELFEWLNPSPDAPPFPSQVGNRRDLVPRDLYDIELNEDYWMGAQIRQHAGTTEEDFSERLITMQANLTVPLHLSSDINVEMKTGGRMNINRRENDVERYFARVVEPGNNRGAADWMESVGIDPNQRLRFLDFMDRDYDRGEYFFRGRRPFTHPVNVDYMDRYLLLARDEWLPDGVHYADSHRRDFKGTETLTAGYIMGDFNIGNRLSVLTGVRYEHYNLDFEAAFVYQTHFDGDAAILDTLNTVDRSVDHLFPNIQIRYDATDWMIFRLAYTQTISRPNYTAMLPNIHQNHPVSQGQAGNPYLNPAISQNYDFSVSFHSNKLGLFTAGAFYKRIEDIFFQTERLYSTLPEEVGYPDRETFEELGLTPLPRGARITTYLNNPHPAYVHGFEFDWQTTFWYLPRPLDTFILNINYTRAYSEMDYQQFRFVDEWDPEQFRNITTEVDTIRNARLLHQGDDVLNIAVGADYRGFSGRISYRLQGDVITSVARRPEEDTFAENVYSLEFSLRQRLPIEGVSIFLSGVNITHAPTENFRYFRRDVTEGSARSNLTGTTYSPRRIEFGVRYSFR